MPSAAAAGALWQERRGVGITPQPSSSRADGRWLVLALVKRGVAKSSARHRMTRPVEEGGVAEARADLCECFVDPSTNDANLYIER